jgi:citrate lyase subunit beta / citryl-CoA lyase
MTTHRSLLFAPGSRPELLVKADGAGADGLLYDLEDSVPPEAKEAARRNVRQALSAAPRCPVYVRINHPDADDARRDVQSLHGSQVRGVVLPKAERVTDIERLSALLLELEQQDRRPPRALVIVLMIETCLGLRNVYELIKCDARVAGVAVASAEEGDLMRDLGGRWSAGGEALIYPRSKLVCEARAAGLEWLIDGAFMNLGDEAALRAECTMARNIGYVAKMAIHPRQLKPIHDAFTPSDTEVTYALGLIAAYQESERRGQGALRYQGMMVDIANVRRAERLLSVSQQHRKEDS